MEDETECGGDSLPLDTSLRMTALHHALEHHRMVLSFSGIEKDAPVVVETAKTFLAFIKGSAA